jgi:uncharacterized membrane protein required for colicin V production
MARQYVEIEKRQYSWLILTIICAVSAIASFIRGFQFLFIDSEKFIIYEIICIVPFIVAICLYPETSEIKKYYVKTERSRKNA